MAATIFAISSAVLWVNVQIQRVDHHFGRTLLPKELTPKDDRQSRTIGESWHVICCIIKWHECHEWKKGYVPPCGFDYVIALLLVTCALHYHCILCKKVTSICATITVCMYGTFHYPMYFCASSPDKVRCPLCFDVTHCGYHLFLPTMTSLDSYDAADPVC